MRIPRSLILAAASAPLILSSAASADFIGLKTVKKPVKGFEKWVALVVNLYAVFSDDDGDGIGDGALIGVAGLPGFQATINVRDGTFYQNPLNPNNGGQTAPPQAVVDMFPSVAVDSFVTIGLKVVPTGVEDDTTPVGLSWTDTRLQISDGAWFGSNPDSLQARPGNFDNPAGQVLIGQFSVAAGAGPLAGVFGTLLIQGEQADGTVFQEYLSFDNQLPAPGAIAVLGTAGVLGWRRRRRGPGATQRPRSTSNST